MDTNPKSEIRNPKSQFQVIPAIDIIGGKCVRLSQGDYAQKKVYNEHPLEVAKMFEDAGLQRLHLVDLDGAKAGKVTNWKVLETIATNTQLTIDFGGGIKALEDVDIVFNSGAALATIGSMAVKDEQLFKFLLTSFGADKFFLGADVKDEKIAVGGWLETTDTGIHDFIQKYLAAGVTQFFCTDISKDGMMQGPGIELYQSMLDKNKDLQLTASGGVSNMNDLHQLKEIGCAGAIVGKAIYEGAVTLKELYELEKT
ncbi:MAG: 1-(5-phosphoribosyl)-5-[(5-phosphoribosylamino)methylideneamino]imidazole-4-carboxamide isomerase [Bacteroidota bacterium]